MEIKPLLSFLAIILLFVGYIPYIKDTIRGVTRPHIFSYLLWSLTTFIIFALQLENGAGAGAWVTFAIGCLMFLVLFLSLKNGRKDITKSDYVFLGIAILTIPIWLIAKLPVLSITLLVLVDLIAFIPGMRKTWVDPYSETLSLYILNSLRYLLATLALVQFNYVTALSPVTSLIANLLFVAIILSRKKFIKLIKNSDIFTTSSKTL